MQLTSHQLTQLVAQARADAPNETCGIIAGKDDRALKIFALPNNSSKPQVEYSAAPHALLDAFREIDARSMEHLAIYHSHPASPAFPSPTDIARAFYPDTIYLIISLMHPEQALVRGFRIVDGQVSEVTLEIEDESPRTNPRRTPRRSFGKLRTRSHPRRAVETFSRRRPPRGNAGGARR